MNCSSAPAVGLSPVSSSDSARSPDSTGHRWPVPVFVVGHGWPGFVQVDWLGW